MGTLWVGEEMECERSGGVGGVKNGGVWRG